MGTSTIENLLGAAKIQPNEWDNPINFSARVGEVLESVAAHPGLLASLLADTADAPLLLKESGSNPTLTKICLYKTPTLELRINEFRNDADDHPHDHRWSFASRLLHGAYRHSLFTHPVGAGSPQPILSTHFSAGNYYCLHHSAIHSVAPETGTITLLLRGPSVKSEWVSYERDSGVRVTHKSSKNSTSQAPLTPAEVRQFRGHLERLGILA